MFEIKIKLEFDRNLLVGKFVKKETPEKLYRQLKYGVDNYCKYTFSSQT